MMLITEMYVPLPPRPVIAFPTIKEFMEGAAAAKAEPIAKSTLEASRMFLLSNEERSFPLKTVMRVFSRVQRDPILPE